MDQWRNKVAIVTGASAGIGAAICRDLCKNQVIVIGLARREDRLEQLQTSIKSCQEEAQFHYHKCDLTKEEDILAAFEFVANKFGGVDVLINNAGVFHNSSFFDEDNLVGMQMVIDTNFMALISCTKKAYKSMVERGCPGYIINISSSAGHVVPSVPGKPILNVYPATKHAVNALVQTLRHELNFFKRNQIRISNISPGCVKTEIATAAGLPLEAGLAGLAMLESDDVSDAVIYILSTPARVQIQDIIIRPTGEFF